ncbi:MAG: thioredoxin fold domain-containing protein [Lentisphaerae bacterium]|nr:thioredoxin fold domain-containing protein [Lentisphaerota bacterium]
MAATPRTFSNRQWAKLPGGFLAGLVVALTPLAVPAQGGSGSADKVSVSHQLSVDRARAGETFGATVIVNVVTGWHVQAAQPSFDYLVPTRLTLDPLPGIRVSAVEYPAAKMIEFAGERLAVYDGIVALRFSVTLSSGVAPGPRALKGSLTIQACDNKVCLAPATVAVAIPFSANGGSASGGEVAGAMAPAGPTVAESLDSTTGAAPFAASPGNEIERLFGERGILLTLLAIFFIGLALNLTPCVYPMLSVTVSIFGAQSDARAAKVFWKAVLYVLGIATMYSALGTMAALTGGMFGGLMQSSWVLLIIALLLAALALSMFGLYEIRLPAALMNRLGGATATGFLGIYLSGLVVGVFAAPCIGPPIIALLALVGAKGSPWFGFGSFFVLALGLGAPYLVLGTFSGLLKRLPKSGAWLIWVRKIFGVVLLGVAFFYAALGFFPGLLRWTPIVTLAVGGIYLGFLERSGNDRRIFRRIKWLLGAAAVASAVALLILEPRTALEWQSYRPESLAAAKAAQQPVVLDFYADWCIPCHELERRTFSDPEVQRALRGHARFKVDLTSMEAPESQELMKAFNVQGVPTVVFLDKNGRERPGTRVLGYLPPTEFLKIADL